MAHIYTSADQLIGKTPLLELTHIEKEFDLKARVLAKLEYLNPAGSVKDRIAKAMIDDTTYAGTGIMVVEDAYAKASRYYTLDADGNPLANPDITRAQLCPIMQELEATLRVAQEKIDEIIQGGKTS